MRSIALLLLLLAPIASAQEVYFSPFDDCEAKAMAVLDGAQRTLDIAQYNIRSERFLDKLKQLRDRGVRIRICVDKKNADNAWNTLDDRFEAEGFDIVRVLNDRSAFAIMHHKFTVVDGATVMTGSYNWNETAQQVNEENMLVLRDPALAAAYTQEFEELRGAPEVAQPGQGQGATVYFSPEDRARDAVVDLMRRARTRIRVAMFTFKDERIARAKRDAARRGVEVLLVVEKKQADTTGQDEVVAQGGAKATVKVVANTSSTHSAMHHKFAVVDDRYVITGACNWTRTAFDFSNEDLLVLDSPAVAAKYTAGLGDVLAKYAPQGFDPATFGIDRPESAAHFVVTCPATRYGETLVLVGGHPALGDWDPRRGVPLFTNESLFPAWSGRVTLPRGARIPWKAVILAADGSVRWEEGDDRVLETGPTGAALETIVAFREGSGLPLPAPNAPPNATPATPPNATPAAPPNVTPPAAPAPGPTNGLVNGLPGQ